ncbi:MAG: hypothetical protein WB524_03880 [Acidobacteriaceae bacterium]
MIVHVRFIGSSATPDYIGRATRHEVFTLADLAVLFKRFGWNGHDPDLSHVPGPPQRRHLVYPDAP